MLFGEVVGQERNSSGTIEEFLFSFEHERSPELLELFVSCSVEWFFTRRLFLLSSTVKSDTLNAVRPRPACLYSSHKIIVEFNPAAHEDRKNPPILTKNIRDGGTRHQEEFLVESQ